MKKNKVLSDTHSCQHNKQSFKETARICLSITISFADTSHPVFLHPSLSISISSSVPLSLLHSLKTSLVSLPRHFYPPYPIDLT